MMRTATKRELSFLVMFLALGGVAANAACDTSDVVTVGRDPLEADDAAASARPTEAGATAPSAAEAGPVAPERVRCWASQDMVTCFCELQGKPGYGLTIGGVQPDAGERNFACLEWPELNDAGSVGQGAPTLGWPDLVYTAPDTCDSTEAMMTIWRDQCHFPVPSPFE